MLTGALSRFGIIEAMEAALSNFHRYGATSSIIFIDLNSFKSINDDYGHDAGDAVLVQIVRLIRENIRETDLVGRYGGDEFIVVLPNTCVEGAESVAQKFKAMRLEITHKGVQLPSVHVSVGHSEINHDDLSIDSWIHRSDQAMYSHKTTNRICCPISDHANRETN